jgi:hypothetical protein
MTQLESILIRRADEQANAVTRDELQRHEGHTLEALTDDERRARLNAQKAESKRRRAAEES